MPSRRATYTAGGVVAALVIIFIIAISVGRKSAPPEPTPVPPPAPTPTPTPSPAPSPSTTSATTTTSTTPSPTTTTPAPKPTTLNLTAIKGVFNLPKAPHWDNATQSLFFVDVYEELIHKYTPSSNTLVTAKVGKGPMAFIIPIAGTQDKFIVSAGPDLGIVTWDGISNTTTYANWTTIGNDVYRANEGKVSPSGALFVGGHSPFKADNATEVEPNKASLYIFKKDKTRVTALEGVTVANGMAWSKDETMFYFIDSLAYTVTSYKYDKSTDQLAEAKVLLNFTKEGIPGVPDGMTIDSEDKLWITSFNGGLVLHFDPKDQKILEKINLDAYQVTSALFGGSDLGHMFVTTGSYKMTDDKKREYPHSGYIFEQIKAPGFGRSSTTFDIKV